MLISLPADLFGRVPKASGVLQAEPGEVAVIDGDTLRLDETVVRLHGVTAPPRGRACRDAQGGVFDCGASAARALAGIVRGQALSCRVEARDGRGFAQARCSAGETDVNAAIVRAGWARAEPGVPEDGAVLAAAEQSARSARLGLWADAARAF